VNGRSLGVSAREFLALMFPGRRMRRLIQAGLSALRAYRPSLPWDWRARHALHRALSTAAMIAREEQEDREARDYALAVLAAAGVTVEEALDPIRSRAAILRACARPNPPKSWPQPGGDA